MGRFGDLVLKTVTAIVNETQNEMVQKAVGDKLRSMLRPLPAEMKLSELVQMVVQLFADRNDYERDGSEKPTVIVEITPSVVCGDYWRLYLDPKEGTLPMR